MASNNPLSGYPLSGGNYRPPPRLIVKAKSPSGIQKGYFWEIVRDDDVNGVVRKSSVSYRSMEEAYTLGSVILNQFINPKNHDQDAKGRRALAPPILPDHPTFRGPMLPRQP